MVTQLCQLGYHFPARSVEELPREVFARHRRELGTSLPPPGARGRKDEARAWLEQGHCFAALLDLLDHFGPEQAWEYLAAKRADAALARLQAGSPAFRSFAGRLQHLAVSGAYDPKLEALGQVGRATSEPPRGARR